MKALYAIAIISGCVAAGVAHASSGDAWDEFRDDVSAACTALLDAPETAEVTIDVDPFGTESYGAALVTVRVGTEENRHICIYDKTSQKAELTGSF